MVLKKGMRNSFSFRCLNSYPLSPTCIFLLLLIQPVSCSVRRPLKAVCDVDHSDCLLTTTLSSPFFHVYRTQFCSVFYSWGKVTLNQAQWYTLTNHDSSIPLLQWLAWVSACDTFSANEMKEKSADSLWESLPYLYKR